MTVAVISDAVVVFGPVALTGRTAKIRWGLDADVKDKTTFASAGWREVLGGIRGGTVQVDGYNDYALDTNSTTSADKALFDELAIAGAPVTAVPSAGAAGALAYTSQTLAATVRTFGPVGEVGPLEAEFATTGPQIRGAVLENAALTVTGNGTAVQLGAIGATQKLHVAFHHLGRSAGTITVTIESDDNSGMTTPTTRATLTASSAVGWQWVTVAGAVTDTWWRATRTITAGTHQVLVAAGIT